MEGDGVKVSKEERDEWRKDIPYTCPSDWSRRVRDLLDDLDANDVEAKMPWPANIIPRLLDDLDAKDAQIDALLVEGNKRVTERDEARAQTLTALESAGRLQRERDEARANLEKGGDLLEAWRSQAIKLRAVAEAAAILHPGPDFMPTLANALRAAGYLNGENVTKVEKPLRKGEDEGAVAWDRHGEPMIWKEEEP